MSDSVYINPYRHTESGAPLMQKSPPRLKSAFADGRKKVVYGRNGFRMAEVIRRAGDCVVLRNGSRNDFCRYVVMSKAMPVSVGARTLAQAMCLFANVRNYGVFNSLERVQGAVWSDGGRRT